MRELDLASLGVQAIPGGDVRGGAIAPLSVALLGATFTLVITNWKDIKQGFMDGFRDV